MTTKSDKSGSGFQLYAHLITSGDQSVSYYVYTDNQLQSTADSQH